MKQYLDLLQHVLDNGNIKGDRTGTGTLSVFGYDMRINLNEGFPLLTTKKVHLKSIIGELLWFLSGNTNAHILKQKYGVSIWDEWCDENGNLGNIYSAQWRFWIDHNQPYKHPDGIYTFGTIDQISALIQQIKENPDSRRLLVSAWNVSDLNHVALPPCHYAFQFYVCDNKLSCKFNMRSTDIFLGLPFNIASYALLTMMIAQVCNLELGDLIFSGADVHIYSNHIEQVKLQLSREPRKLPKMYLNTSKRDIFNFTPEDFLLDEYDPHSSIKAPVAI